MKNILFCIGILMSLNISAQKLEFGAKAGYSYLTSGLELPNTLGGTVDGDGSSGWHAGLFMHARLAGIYIQPELRYLNYKEDFDGGSEIKTNRLDLPVFLGFKTAKILRFQAGPVFSYYISDDFNLEGISDVDASDFTVGLQVGAGLSISKFRADLGYEFGLSQRSIDLVAPGDLRLEGDSRPSLLHITVGFAF